MPFTFLLARQLTGKDVSYEGSGNIGAANVLGKTGTLASMAVLVLDVGKGCFMVLLARVIGMDTASEAAVAGVVVVGHVFPVWLKVCGGKVVATAFGAFVLLAPLSTLVAAVVLLLVAGFTRHVSFGVNSGCFAVATTDIMYSGICFCGALGKRCCCRGDTASQVEYSTFAYRG